MYCEIHAESREQLVNLNNPEYVGPECPDCLNSKQLAGAHWRASKAELKLEKILEHCNNNKDIQLAQEILWIIEK